eukprot:4274853-Alexandrium_andersonii.AAC.1
MPGPDAFVSAQLVNPCSTPVLALLTPCKLRIQSSLRTHSAPTRFLWGLYLNPAAPRDLNIAYQTIHQFLWGLC